MGYWTIDSDLYENVDDILEFLTDRDNYTDVDGFDDWLTDTYGSIDIDGECYTASRILYELDETVYYEKEDEYIRDLQGSDWSDFKYDLEHMNDGETINLQGYDIEYHEHDEDEDGEEDDKEFDDSDGDHPSPKPMREPNIDWIQLMKF